MTDEHFTQVLGVILGKVRQREGLTLADTHPFWEELYEAKKKNKLGESKNKIVAEAFVVVWELTCERCIYVEMPEYQPQIQESALDLDLDNTGPVILYNKPDSPNATVDQFRDYAADFVILVMGSLQQDPHYMTQLASSLKTLASGSVLHFEVAIFLISCIAEFHAGSLTACQ